MKPKQVFKPSYRITNHMKKLVGSLFAIAIVLVAITSQAGKVSVEKAQAELLLIKVHADWCSSCKALEPRLKAISKTLEDEAILFVTLDYTDEKTSAQATMLASSLGIRDTIADHNSTGTVLLIDAKNTKLAGKFSTANTNEEIVDKIKSLL